MSFVEDPPRFLGGHMLTNKPKSKILVDGGDPAETARVKNLLGFVDGQTTNPSLIAKNPEIQQRIASGHTLSSDEEKGEYRKIVQSISPLVGDAGVSISADAAAALRASAGMPGGSARVWVSSTARGSTR